MKCLWQNAEETLAQGHAAGYKGCRREPEMLVFDVNICPGIIGGTSIVVCHSCVCEREGYPNESRTLSIDVTVLRLVEKCRMKRSLKQLVSAFARTRLQECNFNKIKNLVTVTGIY